MKRTELMNTWLEVVAESHGETVANACMEEIELLPEDSEFYPLDILRQARSRTDAESLRISRIVGGLRFTSR